MRRRGERSVARRLEQDCQGAILSGLGVHLSGPGHDTLMLAVQRFGEFDGAFFGLLLHRAKRLHELTIVSPVECGDDYEFSKC